MNFIFISVLIVILVGFISIFCKFFAKMKAKKIKKMNLIIFYIMKKQLIK